MRFNLTIAFLCLFFPVGLMAQTSVELVISEGDSLGGSTITGLNAPFTNGLGQVGFNATLADGNRSIWFNGGEIFNSSDALPDVLTGAETTMGFGNSGQFIYSPSFNGEDSVWNQDGLVLVENTQAPGFPTGTNSTFHSRPGMTDDGTAYWISGFNDGMDGTSSIGRMLYRANPDTSIDVVIRAGDVIDGVEVDDFGGIDFDFHFSGDNSNSMMIVNDANAGSTSSDGTLLVNMMAVASEGSATGQGDNWDNFDWVSINSSGNYVFSGDTDGSTTVDEFIAYNGDIVLREGDAIDGGILDGSVDALSINENGEATFIWELDVEPGFESLFFAADASAMGDATLLASLGDELDVDSDGLSDWVLVDFNAFSGGGIDFAEDGMIYVEVDLESLDGSTEIEAIIGFSTTVIPEPSMLIAFVTLGGVCLVRRRR